MVMNFSSIFTAFWAWYQVHAMTFCHAPLYLGGHQGWHAPSDPRVSAKRWLDVCHLLAVNKLLWLCLPAYDWAPRTLLDPSCQEFTRIFFPNFLVRKMITKETVRTNVGFSMVLFLANSCLSWWFFISHSWWYKIRQPRCAYERGAGKWFCHCWSSCRTTGSCRIFRYWAASGFTFSNDHPVKLFTETRDHHTDVDHHIISPCHRKDCTWTATLMWHVCDLSMFLGCPFKIFYIPAWELHRQKRGQHITKNYKHPGDRRNWENFESSLHDGLCPKYIQESFMVNLKSILSKTFLKMLCTSTSTRQNTTGWHYQLDNCFCLDKQNPPGRPLWAARMPAILNAYKQFRSRIFLLNMQLSPRSHERKRWFLLSCSSSWWENFPVITDCSWCMESRAFDRGHFKLWGL